MSEQAAGVLVYLLIAAGVWLGSALFSSRSPSRPEELAALWTMCSLFWPVPLVMALIIGPLALLKYGWERLNATAGRMPPGPESTHKRY